MGLLAAPVRTDPSGASRRRHIHTLRGNALHAQVDKPGVQTTKSVRVERALPLWHLRYDPDSPSAMTSMD